MICDACGGSGTVLRPRDSSGRERPIREWFAFCVPCWGSGVTPNDFAWTAPKPPAHGRPYRVVNQVDWFGALWSGATFVYEAEAPAHAGPGNGSWMKPLARCAQWDSRDGSEAFVFSND